jgi:hypothetical protein
MVKTAVAMRVDSAGILGPSDVKTHLLRSIPWSLANGRFELKRWLKMLGARKQTIS